LISNYQQRNSILQLVFWRRGLQNYYSQSAPSKEIFLTRSIQSDCFSSTFTNWGAKSFLVP
jgi:hypothetical protein